MFIIIHYTVDIDCREETVSSTYLSMENPPATSYIAATFHPTIGQRAHQSLSNTATPELGMISTRSKGNISRLTRSQGYTKLSQANTVGFIRITWSYKVWLLS